MNVFSKVLKPVKKLPKMLLKLPRKLLKIGRSIWEFLVTVGSKLVVYPLDSFSGKCFAAFQTLSIVTLLFGGLYLYWSWRGSETLVAFAYPLLVRALIALGLVLVIFAISYPLDQRGQIEATLVRTGIRQYNRTSVGLISGVVSLPTTLLILFYVGNREYVTSFVLYLFGQRHAETYRAQSPLNFDFTLVSMFVFFVFFFMASFITMNWLLRRQNESYLRTDLSIVDVTKDTGDMKGIQLQNDSDGAISLSMAKIKDARDNSYTLNNNPSFRPGEIETISLPAEFTLERTEYEVPTGLGWLYDRYKQARIYTRSGDTFVLEWSDQ